MLSSPPQENASVNCPSANSKSRRNALGLLAGMAVLGTGAAQTAAIQRIWMTVGARRFALTLADGAAARALAARLPLTLDMDDLNRNEKKATLSQPLPTDTYRPGTIRSGDILLWGADTLVVFYLTFDSPYAYTRLGRLDDATGLAEVLGPGDVRIRFSRE
jgi:hypothetical protein